MQKTQRLCDCSTPPRHQRTAAAVALSIRRFTACLGAAAVLVASVAAAADSSDRAFVPGERLAFKIWWGPIPAGEAVLEVRPVEWRNGTALYHFVMEVKTSPVLDLIYFYRSRIDAYAAMPMNRSLGYEQTTRTARKEKKVVVDFDWQAHRAYFERTETFFHPEPKTNVKSLETPILPGTFDPLSAFYYSRMLTLADRSLIERPISDGKRTLRANLKVIGRQTIPLDGRSHDTILVQPDLKGINPIFEQEAGAPILIWVSADAHRIPLRLKSRVRIGSFTGELVGVEGVRGYDLGRAGGDRPPDQLADIAAGFPEP